MIRTRVTGRLSLLVLSLIAIASQASASEAATEADDTDEWSHIDLTNGQRVEDFVRIPAKQRIATKEPHGGPLEINLWARTDSTNIRLNAFGGAFIIWNWEVNQDELRVHLPQAQPQIGTAKVTRLRPNTWYKLRVEAAADEVRVYTDNKLVYRRNGQYRLTESPVSVGGAFGSVVDLKEFSVRRLGPQPANVAEKRPARPNPPESGKIGTSPPKKEEPSSRPIKTPPGPPATVSPKPEPTPVAPAKQPPSTPAPQAPISAFAILATDEPVTSMALSEDGNQLLISHQAANRISVWDVLQERLIQTIETAAPRSLLVRGNRAFVANFGQGTITVLTLTDRWKPTDQIGVDKPRVVHLSAARGKHFNNELIVTCHDDGPQASYQGSAIYHLDIARGKARQVSKGPVATVSYDGKLVFVQDSFNLSPPGAISAISYADFTAGRMDPVFRYGREYLPWFYQAHQGSYWLSDRVIVGGVPAKVLHEVGNVLIPDMAERVVYELGENKLVAHKIDVAFSELDQRKLELPDEIVKEFGRLSQAIYRTRGYLLDHPVAFTHGDTLYLFAIDYGINTVRSAKVARLNFPSQGTAPADNPPPVVANSNAARPSAPTPPVSPAPKVEVTAKDVTAQAGGALDKKLEAFPRLSLDADHFQLTPGLEYRSLLLLQGDVLRQLGPDGFTVAKEYKLPGRYRQIAERSKSWVALGKDPHVVDVIDKQTLKVTRHIPLAARDVRIMDLNDLAVHPTKSICYVAIKHDIQPPRYRVLVVDESSGSVTAPEDLIGTWVAVDPSGNTLYTGYKDIYERGSRFHLNPGWQLIEIPEYGSIDWLLTYSLRGKEPVLKQLVKKAGGNGTGIRLSTDGKRLTYLSVVGYPMFSGNLGGFSTADLDAQPVTYAAHKIAGTQIFAYHPTLPLVAAGSKDAIVLFHRETGAMEADRLLLTAKGISGAPLEQIWFSPDGSGLILFCVPEGEARYLRRVALRLSDTEKAIVARGVATAKTVERPATPGPRVKLTDFESLKPPTAAAGDRSPKQIGQDYMNAVVQVRSQNASATGIAVGARGYVLTSAHAIDDDSDVTVLYQTQVQGAVRTTSTKAAVVYRDDDSDLALLKIGPVTPLKTVVLARPEAGKPIQAGEAVTVIGHPGVGTQVLSHTLTTGVVSNAQRTIEGLEYIQTSAAVNPGNSGGPMFDSRGQVIGMVSLKARLEGAAFAIPASRLRKFLETCVAGDQ